MRIKVGKYEGILIELDSVFQVQRDILRNVVHVVLYRIVILCDDNAKVEIRNVKPAEIEVLHD